ncbi:c-type cytochrome [Aquabacterium sp. J223]|uniref:c-type cytochrome n=1 Tax=Aquabacterium sp. J223 TaxID=2898431 RepID=UPI0021AD56C1|nr:c-type cytochrome [Aquabacterium sp. J223]UUX95251.1 c-type cytochrome [Aquabacterium sp. J223]
MSDRQHIHRPRRPAVRSRPAFTAALHGAGWRAAALLSAALAAGCTDRLAASDDRWGASGALIAVSGGEGGARYACATCHGARGEGNGFDAPRLAGLPAGYLQKQMEDYAAGLRPHAVMRDVAGFLDSHERVRVANHYAALAPAGMPAATEERPAAATAGLYARACATCHGADATGTVHGPPLNAQPALYLAQQLQDWQKSKRRNDGNHAMLKVARQLGSEDVRQLSLYLARIPARPADPAR